MKLVVAASVALLSAQLALARQPYVDYLPNLPAQPSRPLETEQEYLSLPLDEEAHFFRRVSSAEYKSVLRAAASGNRNQLALVFSAAQYQDGAGAESYASTLFWLLHRAGDAPFSATLAKQPKPIRTRVVGLLDFAADYDYSARFPKTFRLSKHAPQ